MWSCRRFHNIGVNECWNVAREKQLCFHCLASDHEGRACTEARPCNINGCKRIIITYCMASHRVTLVRIGVVSPREGAPAHTHTPTSKQETATETFSLRTVPVWLKANDCKLNVNALRDDGSNETFSNEEVAGGLGLKER